MLDNRLPRDVKRVVQVVKDVEQSYIYSNIGSFHESIPYNSTGNVRIVRVESMVDSQTYYGKICYFNFDDNQLRIDDALGEILIRSLDGSPISMLE